MIGKKKVIIINLQIIPKSNNFGTTVAFLNIRAIALGVNKYNINT